MPNRREFIAQAAAAGAILGRQGTGAAANEGSTRSEQAMRMLMLGGTGHIGQYFVRAAVDRGHHVSVFSRGSSLDQRYREGQFLKRVVGEKELPDGVEFLTGDRNGNLESIKNRDWDAVLDLTTFVPKWVRTLGEALRGRVKHYTFISSVSVYENPHAHGSGLIYESSKVHEYDYQDAPDPYSLTELVKQKNDYAPLKVLCEREAESHFPGKVLVVRPCYVVGPHDRPGALPYLILRMEQGGEILAGGDPLTHVQIIDIRDMAEWIIRMAEQRVTGIFNAGGPALPMGFAELLGALRAMTPQSVTLTWIPTQWLKEQKVPEWSNFLFWATEASKPGSMSMVNDKARAHGLTFRPLAETVSDTLAWYKGQSPEQLKDLFFLGTVKDSMEREAELLKAWHAHQARSS